MAACEGQPRLRGRARHVAWDARLLTRMMKWWAGFSVGARGEREHSREGGGKWYAGTNTHAQENFYTMMEIFGLLAKLQREMNQPKINMYSDCMRGVARPQGEESRRDRQARNEKDIIITKETEVRHRTAP